MEYCCEFRVHFYLKIVKQTDQPTDQQSCFYLSDLLCRRLKKLQCKQTGWNIFWNSQIFASAAKNSLNISFRFIDWLKRSIDPNWYDDWITSLSFEHTRIFCMNMMPDHSQIFSWRNSRKVSEYDWIFMLMVVFVTEQL